MINILSEYHAKNKDEKSEHAKGKESGKDAPHGTDEENRHRQNCQHGQPTATPPTKAHTKRTATYTTKPTNDHFIQNFMPVGAKPKPRFKSCCISVLFFITLTFFLCLVGGFTLLVSGGRYGRGENMQGFW